LVCSSSRHFLSSAGSVGAFSLTTAAISVRQDLPNADEDTLAHPIELDVSD
jgi:hypothetical protein